MTPLNIETILPKIKLEATEIHLWCASQNEINDPVLLSLYAKLLSDEEKKQWRRFRFERHRHQYLITRALVRSVLSHYHHVAPEEWLFSKNKYGRPEAVQQPKTGKLRFNLSRTDGLILCGVVLNDDIGVDVENTNQELSVDEMAKFSLSSLESRELMNLSRERQQLRLYDYWTLKESFIKARGMGLSLPLKQFSFHLGPKEPLKISFDSKGEDPRFWHFWRLQLSDNHLGAVAVKNTQSNNYRLTIKKIVPLKDEFPMDHQVIDQSPLILF
ncbi:MAG: 4'-phosphopantetheinyl transferase superfamily protein [Desulfotalea sp.]